MQAVNNSFRPKDNISSLVQPETYPVAAKGHDAKSLNRDLVSGRDQVKE